MTLRSMRNRRNGRSERGLAASAAASLLVIAALAGCGPGQLPPPSYPTLALVTNSGDNTLSRYVVDTRTGALTPAGPAVPVGHSPRAVSIQHVADPASTGYKVFVYVVNEADNSISQFQIAKNGAITPLDPPTVATGNDPVSIIAEITASPSGMNVVVLNRGDRTVSGYSTDASGHLHLVKSVSAGASPVAMASALNGLWIANQDGTITQLSFVTFSPKSAASVATIPNASNIIVDTDFVYVLSATDKKIGYHRIPHADDLVIGPKLGEYSTAGNSQAVESAVGFYSANTNGTVEQFSKGTNGTLTPLSPATVSTGGNPSAIKSKGSNIYVVDKANNNILKFFASGGDPRLASPGVAATTGSQPTFMLIDDLPSDTINPGVGGIGVPIK